MCLVLVFTIDREGRHVLKKAWGSAKARQKQHEFLVPNLAKIDQKNEENRVGDNNRPKNGSWDGLLPEKVDFGSILGSLGKPLGRPWEGSWGKKIEAKKKVKKSVEGAFLGGRRVPRQGGILVDRTGMDSKVSHALCP